jgi:hypothetical protein
MAALDEKVGRRRRAAIMQRMELALFAAGRDDDVVGQDIFRPQRCMGSEHRGAYTV